MKIIRPPDGEVRPHMDIHSLFLVGPTPRVATVKSWRPEALAILEEIGYNGWVYVPEPFHGGYKQQIRWETLGLCYVDVIAAWVARDMRPVPGIGSPSMPALTTNIEWGEYLHDPKLVYGRPGDSPHCGYLDERYLYRDNRITGTTTETCSKFGNQPHTTLRSLLVAATEGHCS